MPEIPFVFRSIGHDAVRQGLRGIRTEAETTEKAFARMERTMRQAQQVQARSTRQRASTTVDDKAAERDYQAKVKERENLARQVAKTQERQAREETKVRSREETQRDRDFRRSVADRERAAKRVAADQEREEKRSTSRRLADEKRALDQSAQAGRRHARERLEIDKRVARERKHAEDEGIRQAKQRGRAQAQEEIKLAAERKRLREDNRIFKDIGGELKGFAIGAAATTIAAGVGITTMAAREALQMREVVNRLSISARGAGEEAVDPAQLQREFQQTAIKTPGIKAIDVAAAVQGFVTKTGRLDVARQQQGVFATVASATGGRIEDIADAAADLFQKFDITSMEDMADALAALTFQGKAGAFELKDAASQFARLSSAASRFGLGKGTQSVRVLGGLTQIARSATGSPEQAATAIEAMFRQFTAASTQKEFRKIGVNVFKDKKQTQARDIRDLLVETISKSQGNLTTLGHIFGEEGIRGISPLISTFNQAKEQAKTTGVKGEAEQTAFAVAALRKSINDAIDAPGDFAELQKDAAQAQQDASAKVTAAWEKIVAGIGEKALPAIAELADKLTESPDAIDALVGTIEVVIDTFQGLILLLQDLGIISKKTKTLGDIQKEEKAKADLAQKQLDKLPGQKEIDQMKKAGDLKKAKEIEDKRLTLTAKRDVALERAQRAEDTAQKDQKLLTQQQIEEQYLALKTGPKTQEDINRARDVAEAISTAPTAAIATRGQMAEESESQMRFRQTQSRTMQEERVRAGGQAEGRGAQLAVGGLDELMKAAKAAADALNKVQSQNNPSVVAGT